MVILQEGDAIAGGTVTNVNVPFINGNGQVGFTGSVDIGGNSEGFVFYDNGLIFLGSDLPADMLTGAETFMGIGNNMEFIYSPSANGSDAVYTQNGQLAVEDVQAPGLPAGLNSTFHSRPRMTADGTSYWISGYNDGMGGTASIGRIFYTATPAGVISTLLLGETTTIMGQTIDDGSAIGFDFGVADDNSNYINEVNFATGNTNTNGAIVLNGSSTIAQEASPNGDGDNWDNFDLMDVNNNGDYVFSGDTDGASTSDEFIAVNGSIALREGTTVDGIDLSSASVRGLDLNNNGLLLQLWGAGSSEYLIVGNINNLANTSKVIAATGDQIDTDGDGNADIALTDINTFGSSVSLADDGTIFISADYTEIGMTDEIKGILKISDFALPVNYLSFTARLNGAKSVELDWSTAIEENNLGFEIERSTPAEPNQWDNIGTVAGRGDQQSINSYNFQDNAPFPGLNFYRLRQVDYDGSYSLSSIVSATIRSDENDLVIFPTTTTKEIAFRFTETVEIGSELIVEIQDLSGKQISNFAVNGQTISLSSGVPAGSYLLSFKSGVKTWTRRFVKQ